MKKKLSLGLPTRGRFMKKTLLIMKLIVLLLIVGLTNLSASVSAQMNRLSIDVDQTSVKAILRMIEEQSDCRFLYNEDFKGLDCEVTLAINDLPIEEALKLLFKEQDLTYKIFDNNLIVITPASLTLQQSLSVRGIVKDAGTGEPLPGVNILIEGTNSGTVTGVDGSYEIEVPDANAVLMFSYVGYNTEKFTVGSNTRLDVMMVPDIKQLSEVVVVGYGVQKKVNVTGAVAALDGDLVSQKLVTQLSAALQGMAPGVTITQSTGQPGVDAGTIRIRGIGTLNDNDPLVLVDGVEADINDVDANDIENISILKDAAASAIYGVRAANGVVLITTKRGSKDKAKVTYSGYVGFQNPTKLPDFVGAQDFMELVNLTRTNSGAGALYTNEDIAAYDNPNRNLDTYPDELWIEEVLSGSGFQQEHSLAVSGGSGNVMYRLSANYFDQDGLVKRTNFDRLTIRLNSDIEVNKHLSISADLAGKFSYRTEPQGGMWMQFGQAMVTNPTIPIRYTNGDWSVGRGDGNVIRLQSEGGRRKYEDNLMTGNFKANYKIFNDLTFTAMVNGTYDTYFVRNYTQALEYYLPSGGTIVKDNNSLTDQTVKNWTMNYQGLLNYTKTIGDHSIALLAGASKITNRTNLLSGYRHSGSLADLPQLNAGDPSTQENDGYFDDFALLSYFGRLNYAFKDRYLVEANIRRDASSRFAEENHWGTFPSFSLGWRISKEAFMSSIAFIKELKIRGSWGMLGNQEVGSNYAYQSLVNLGRDYPFGNNLISGARMSTYPNREISWETTQMTDFGVDASVLNGQLDFSFDYYVKVTSDILLSLPIPSSVGLGAPVQNAGEVENRGWEFTVGYRGQAFNDLRYGVRFNLSDVKNKITDLKDADFLQGNNDNIIWAYYEGHPIGAYYGYDSEGILRTDAQLTGHVTQFGNAVVKGDLGYVDHEPDGNINSRDRTIIGSDIPRYTYGFNIDLAYKGLDFIAFFQGVGKVDVNTLQFNKAPTSADGNFRDFQQDNWREDNVGAEFPRLITSTQNYVSSSFWIKSGAYLRLKNIQLGYTLNSALTQKVGISRCRLYIAGQNLFTWSGLNDYGIDPENPTDNRYYPQVKTYTLGINVDF